MELPIRKKYVKLTISLIIASLMYKIALPNFIDTSYFSRLMSLPYSMISKYTKYINILQLPMLGILLQSIFLANVLLRYRIKLIIRFNSALFYLELLIFIRIISYFIFYDGSVSIYYLLTQVLLLCTAMFIKNINPYVKDLPEKITLFLEVYSVICAITAILYYYQIAGLNVLVFRHYRISGIYPDAVSVVLVYGVGLFSILYRLLNKKEKKHIIISFIELILILIGGLMTGSRSFFIFSALSVILVLFTIKRNRMIWTIIGVTTIVALIAYFLLGDALVLDIDSISDASRITKSQTAIKAFLDHPVLGIGTSNYHLYEEMMGYKGTNPHNMFFEVLSENGLVGAIIYIIMITRILSIIFNKRRSIRMSISVVCIIMWFILSMIVGVMSSSFLMTIFMFMLHCAENELYYQSNELSMIENI